MRWQREHASAVGHHARTCTNNQSWEHDTNQQEKLLQHEIRRLLRQPRRGAPHLLVGRHSSAPSGLGAVLAEVLVVVSSAGLLAEAPGLPVGVHAPESVVALSWSQLQKMTTKRPTQ